MQHMICAERMRLTVYVQPGGEKTVPADPFNVGAETVPDRRIQQVNMELRGLQTLQTQKRPVAYDMRQAASFATGSRAFASRAARSLLARGWLLLTYAGRSQRPF